MKSVTFMWTILALVTLTMLLSAWLCQSLMIVAIQAAYILVILATIQLHKRSRK